MKRIPLRGKDGKPRAFALVDDEDYEHFCERRWQLGADGYARATIYLRGHKSTLMMHRVVLGLHRGDPREADHINRDKLDNRRENLRIVTHLVNGRNVPGKGAKSGHRNVYWNAMLGKWQVRVKREGKAVYGGVYGDVEAAAARALELLIELHPESYEALTASGKGMVA